MLDWSAIVHGSSVVREEDRMSDAEEALRRMTEERGPTASRIRIYVLSETDLPIRAVSATLPDYEVVPSHSKNEAALIHKVAVESEQECRSEVERVAEILVPLLTADSYLSCVYDDSAGRTQFLVEMRKTGGMPNFIETDTGR